MKKKTLLKLSFLAVSLAVLVSFVGCDLSGTFDSSSDDLVSRRGGPPVSVGSPAVNSIPEAYAGETGEVNWIDEAETFGYQSFTYGLWAGQNLEAGTVTISNDADLFYVTVETYASLDEVHIYLYDSLEAIPSSRPAPGRAPYSAKSINDSSVTIEIPAANVADGKTYYFIIHAALKAGNDPAYDYLAGETAYAAGSDAPSFNGRGAWFYAVSYVITEVSGETDDEDSSVWKKETAYAGDSAGSGNAWWFYFDTSKGTEQGIYAGQNLVSNAVVSYSRADGLLIIDLGDKMRLKDTDESVKIQGYNQAVPDSRPAAGQFTTYKGSDLTVEVSHYDFFVIHLDAEVL